METLRWSLAPANREESVALLMSRLKLSNDIADRTLRALSTCKVSATCSPEKYVDLSCYDRALKRVKQP